MKVTRRNSSHGNFHFYPDDLVKLEKSGSFRMYLKGLSTVRERIRHKHLRNSSESIIQKINNSNREWQEFNRSLQFVIDNKLQELEQKPEVPSLTFTLSSPCIFALPILVSSCI